MGGCGSDGCGCGSLGSCGFLGSLSRLIIDKMLPYGIAVAISADDVAVNLPDVPAVTPISITQHVECHASVELRLEILAKDGMENRPIFISHQVLVVIDCAENLNVVARVCFCIGWPWLLPDDDVCQPYGHACNENAQGNRSLAHTLSTDSAESWQFSQRHQGNSGTFRWPCFAPA